MARIQSLGLARAKAVRSGFKTPSEVLKQLLILQNSDTLYRGYNENNPGSQPGRVFKRAPCFG